LNKSQLCQKISYDKKKGFHTSYKENDLVLVWKPLSPAIKDYRKLRNCYSGPWCIKRVLSQWTYLVQHVHSSKQSVVHFDSLKLIPSSLRMAPRDTRSFTDSDKGLEGEEKKEKSKDDQDETLPMVQMMFGTTTKPYLPPEPDVESTPSTADPATTRYDLRPRPRIHYSK
jgi:hypothetical protein